MMKKSAFLIVLIAVVLNCSSQKKDNFLSAEDLRSTIDQFEGTLKTELKNDASISGVVIYQNKIIWSKALGISSFDEQIKADTTTIYRTGSISKTFTAVLMMQMEQEGIIKLNDPIENYLPEIKNLNGYLGKAKITFRQLASHSSGLIREPKLKNAASGPISEWEAKILESIPHTSFSDNPGKVFSYSNIGYGILGLALSRAAKKPFMDLIESKIFKPLGMNNSYFIVPNTKLSSLSQGSVQGVLGMVNREKPQNEHKGRGYKVPNGGIYSTPNDMAKFIFVIMGQPQKLLSQDNLELMQNTFTTGDKEQPYGLGLIKYRDSVLTTFGHGGYVAGYTSNFAIDKNNGNGVILMGNYSENGPNIAKMPLDLLRALASLKSLE